MTGGIFSRAPKAWGFIPELAERGGKFIIKSSTSGKEVFRTPGVGGGTPGVHIVELDLGREAQ